MRLEHQHICIECGRVVECKDPECTIPTERFCVHCEDVVATTGSVEPEEGS